MKYRLAERVQVHRTEAGPRLVAERPLRVLKINGSLAAALEAAGRDWREPSGRAETEVWERLVQLGLAERPHGPVGAQDFLPSVSVVIPVRDRADELARCLGSLGRVRYPADKFEVVVVDDGSGDASREVARSAGATVVSSGGTGRGPGAARNRGAAVARGEILAFLDSDCKASPGWLADLVGAFADPRVAAVGGRVEGMHVATALDRYEAVMSSLSLGLRERRGSLGDDTFYLPSCNLLVRRTEFVAAGGFREELHVGEDVDLTWRLRDQGRTLRYLPVGWVYHEHRNRLGPFLRRRFQYGTSEGVLQKLHPQRRKRLVLPPTLSAILALGAVAGLASSRTAALAALALIGADALGSARAVRSFGAPTGWARILAARLRAAAGLGYYCAYHLVRYYGIPLAALGLAYHPLGALVAAMALLTATVDFWVRRPGLSFPAFLALYLSEQAAYGAGAFWGCWKRGTFASYRPLFLTRLEMQTE